MLLLFLTVCLSVVNSENCGAVVAQFAEPSLPTEKDTGSNPVIGYVLSIIYLLLAAEKERK